MALWLLFPYRGRGRERDVNPKTHRNKARNTGVRSNTARPERHGDKGSNKGCNKGRNTDVRTNAAHAARPERPSPYRARGRTKQEGGRERGKEEVGCGINIEAKEAGQECP